MTTPRLLSDRYELGETLGYGGMSEVHRGRDVRLGRDVAVKVLRADLARDPQFQERFRREAQNAAALNHPAIVAVYDTGETRTDGGPLPYIVMEYVDGRTLRDIVKTEGPLPGQRAMEIMADVCAALDFSHRHGIVHRDVKPANVMITRTGAVKVMDFGIARAVADGQAAVTQTAAVIGTAQYLSPEQARGEAVDARSDVYAAGCVLFELLTGEPPFTGDSPVAVAYQHVREDPKPPSTLNNRVIPQLDAIVLKAMAKGQANRYQSAAEMRADLVRVLSGQRPSAPMVMTDSDRTTIMNAGRPPERTGRHRPGALADDYDDYDDYGGYDEDDEQARRKRRNWLIAGGVLAAVLVALLVYWLATNDDNKKSADTDTYTVPKLVGLSIQDATAQLKKDGITVQTKYVKCGTGESGGCGPDSVDHVVATDPAEGQTMSKNASIVLSVGQKPDQITVPAVTGLSLTDAQKKITDAKLQVASNPDESETCDSSRWNKVLEQDPPDGTPVEPGTQVKLTLGKQPPSVSLDNYVGQDYDAAVTNLQGKGLKATRKDTKSDKPKGEVIDQAPGEGQDVAKCSVITLTVSNGQPPDDEVTVPNLVGMTEDQARQVLAGAGFTGTVSVSPVPTNDPTEDGVVTAQNPDANQKVKKSGTVQIQVAKFQVGGGGGGGGG